MKPPAVPAAAAELARPYAREHLIRAVFLLAIPVVAEQFLHSIVGFTGTWLANHLVAADSADAKVVNGAAGAAVGTVQYVLWFVGMVAGAVGTGATAIISRSVGARDRRSANATCGQSVLLALVVGAVLGAAMFTFASQFAAVSGLEDRARDYLASYMRQLAVAMPLTLLMFAAGACLRGAGDTITPALAMIVVDTVNVFFIVGLTYGRFGLPTMGFDGIAMGTVIAYAVGGLLLLAVLLRRRGFMRLYVHRLRPNWFAARRILRIGLPGGAESMMQWLANFVVLYDVNKVLGNASAAVHANAIRLESFSFLTGMGFATAAATLVGQSLGMGDPRRARHCGYLAYAMGGGIMTLMGVAFLIFGRPMAGLMSDDAEVVRLTADCIRTTGYIQCGFAAAMIFGFAMRGAGDTFKVMTINLASIFLVRFAGVLICVRYFGLGLQAVWYVLCGELMLRGALMFLRFRFGRWDLVKV